MKVVSIINLKGGVAKTISSVNIAHILATVHNKRVLLVDNDKQGNASKMFGLHSYDKPSIAEVMTERNPNMNDIIAHTPYTGLDVLPANMDLLRANMQVLLDTSRQQQTRLGNALKQVADRYDFCIIDNAPDINISVINALVASHDVLIPVKIDKFAFDGLAELKEQIENTRDELNPNIAIRGCFVTCYQRNEVNMQGEEWMKAQTDFPVFGTHIRKTEKVDESTFACMPIIEYSRRCGAAMDYLKLVSEYLDVSESDTKGS